MKRPLFVTAALIVALCSTTAKADLLISGVVDGNESGGIPKGIELVATSDIADLSIFSIGRYTNGGAGISSVTALPSISLNTGDFFYITGTTSSDIFFTNAGFTVGLSNQTVANINGDDLLQIVSSADNGIAFDTFGLPGQGDTDFYANSYAYRNNSSQTGDVLGSLDASANFTIAGWDETAWASTFGSFQVTAIPEPAIAGLLGLGLVGLACTRRRV